ncbi:TlpA family protein disulfide reductase [bacterium]|nr:TlpA family protein disulfide reductase [bacterium]
MKFFAPRKHQSGASSSMSLSAVLFVTLLVISGCKKEEPNLPPTPVGPDPEVSKLMIGEKKAADPDFKPNDIIPPPPPVAATTPPPKSDSTSAPTVDVKEVDFAGFHKEIEGLKGKIVVIDCWATWCSICKEKFPKFLELKDKYSADANIVFANLANDPADKLSDVKEFLVKSNASFLSFLLDEDPADFAQHFQVNGVPAYLIYSADGELTFKTGKIEELTAKLAELSPPKN